MKPILPTDRRIANISAPFTPFVYPDGVALGGAALQPNTDRPLGEGFFLYRMPAGMMTREHRHNGEEHFYVLEGELIDNDGTVLRKGDIVSYRDGAEHSSHSPTGCLLVVYVTGAETVL